MIEGQAFNALISATGNTGSPGDDWLEVGAGISTSLTDSSLLIYLDMTSQRFRNDMNANYYSVGASMSF